MIGKQYIITSDLFTGQILFKYSLKGYLKAVEMDVSNIKMVQFNWIWDNLPKSTKQVNEMQKQAGNFKVEEIPADLSFEHFWEEYNYKRGSKKTAEQRWKRLTEAKKIKALDFIPKYRSLKKQDGTALQYPEVYLNKEPFMN